MGWLFTWGKLKCCDFFCCYSSDFLEINEALGRNFATPDGVDEADLDAELDMLGDELEEELQEEAETTPSYLMPATPNALPGLKEPTKVDEFGLPSAPIGNP